MARKWTAVSLLVTSLADVAGAETVTWQAAVLAGVGGPKAHDYSAAVKRKIAPDVPLGKWSDT